MSNDIVLMEHKLLIAEQQAKMLAMEHRLQMIQMEKVSKLEDSLYSPKLYQHYYRMAEMVSKSDMVPRDYKDKPSNIFIAWDYGYSLGMPLSQCLQDIGIVHGKPALYGDGLMALALSHPECESIVENPIIDSKTGIISGYSCTIKRRGHTAHTKTFTLQDAEHAKLIRKDKPDCAWMKYPTRMLQMRARGLCIRDKFADALRGIKSVEELQGEEDYTIEGTATLVKGPDQVENLKAILRAGESSNVNPQNSTTSNSNDVLLHPNQDANSQAREADTKDSLSSGENGSTEGTNGVGNQTQSSETSDATVDVTPITPESIAAIEEMMNIKAFDENRRKKAIAYFKVEKLEELTAKQAKTFMAQLAKC
jgi:hypothetical protein